MRVATVHILLALLASIGFAQTQQTKAGQQPAQCPADQVACASTEGPTYEATRDSIISTLNQVAGSEGTDPKGGTDYIAYSGFNMDACHLKFGVRSALSSTPSADFSYQVEVPLANISGVELRPSNNPGLRGMMLTIESQTTAINELIGSSEGRAPLNLNQCCVDIWIGRTGIDIMSYAQRLQKALVHAAALCRAQAAQHPSNEPF